MQQGCWAAATPACGPTRGERLPSTHARQQHTSKDVSRCGRTS